MKTLGVLLFPEFETLDVFGPLEMFGQLKDKITIVLISEHIGLVKSAQGQAVMAEFSWENAPRLDYLLVPGGMGVRKEIHRPNLISWIKARSAQADLTLSVCTGAALLAKAHILDGYKATTNQRAFDWVSAQSALVHWIPHVRWVDEGHIVTSAGVSAGIDMSLFVIGKLFGEEMRDDIAKITEYRLINLP